MKNRIKLFILLFLLLFPLLAQAEMRTSSCEGLWPYVLLYDKEQESCERLVIFLHGDGVTQENVTSQSLPTYNNGVQAGKNAWVVCPIGKEDGDFANNINKLILFIAEMKKECGAKYVYLVGYSNGAVAAYRVAMSICRNCDGYVFLSLPTGNLGNHVIPSNSLYVTGDTDKNKDAIFKIFSDLLNRKPSELAKLETVGNRALLCGNYSHGSVVRFLKTKQFARWMDALENGGDLYEALK